MNSVKLLALDLDGTLLNSQKELTPRTRDALYAAAEAGVEIVPTTGRFFTGMPEVIQKLPFLHYAITINGAQVYDIRAEKAVSRAEIPLETALRVLEYLDGFPVIYDCYQDNWGWMTRSMQETAAAFIPFEYALRMVRELLHCRLTSSRPICGSRTGAFRNYSCSHRTMRCADSCSKTSQSASAR